MTVRLGADATSTSVSELKSLGATFVCRYLSPAGNTWKNLTKSEADGLKAAGIDIVSNWEFGTGDYQGGYTQGVNYAKQAEAMHLACGGPPAAPIYFSVDSDINPADAAGYFQGIVSVLGVARTGVYASTATCNYLKSSGLVSYTWRTMSTDWSGGAGSTSDFNIEQTGFFNSSYDRDAAITADFGQWSAHGGAVTTPVPVKPPVAPPAGGQLGYQYNATHSKLTPVLEDGLFGRNSWKAVQAVLFGSTSTEVDGIDGPHTNEALQVMLDAYHGAKLAHDGVLTQGGNTIKSVQEKAGASQTGLWSFSSYDQTSLAVQKALNSGTFWGAN